MSGSAPDREGFSLLEIMIATAILAVVFAYTSSAIIQGGYFQSKAPIYTQAAFHVRAVVLDLEAEYARDGFPEKGSIKDKDCDLPSHAEDRGFSCRYDLEALEVEQSELAAMAGEVMEGLMGQVGDEGNILMAIPALAAFVSQAAMQQQLGLPISPTCPVTLSDFMPMCQINFAAVAQNMMGMIGMGFPIIIDEAAKRTRKLRVRIFNKRLEPTEPVLDIETFIIVIAEEVEKQRDAAEQAGELLEGLTQPSEPAQPATQPATQPPAGTTR